MTRLYLDCTKPNSQNNDFEINEPIAKRFCDEIDKAGLHSTEDELIVYLDSHGGNIWAGLMMYSKVKSLSCKTTVYNMKFASSAAFTLFLGFRQRIANHGASSFIHQSYLNKNIIIQTIQSIDMQEIDYGTLVSQFEWLNISNENSIRIITKETDLPEDFVRESLLKGYTFQMPELYTRGIVNSLEFVTINPNSIII